MTEITGKTKLVGIIGYPLTYTLSPAIHNAAFADAGLNWCYLPLVVEEPNLLSALDGLRSLGFVGVNVTMPYKESVVDYVDEVSTGAEVIGAINTILVSNGSLVGYNTDSRGFVTAVEQEAKFKPKGKRVAIIGAGGAGKGVAVGLALAGMARLDIVNRTLERAEELRTSLNDKFPDVEVAAWELAGDISEAITEADLVVNATPIGMEGQGESAIDPDLLHAGQLVCDLVYRPVETPLIKEARGRGATTLGGLPMLVYQAAASFEIWTGVSAPTEAMMYAAVESQEASE